MISVSLICADYNDRKNIQILEEKADFIHFDLMNLDFSSCTAFDVQDIKRLKLNPNKIDVHISALYPDVYVDKCIDCECAMICFPVESKTNIAKNLEKIRKNDIKAGLSVKPDTKIEVLEPFLPLVDYVNVLTIFPGPPGQDFQVAELNKIISLRKLREKLGLNYLIEVDGSVNESHFYDISKCKPDILVVGTSGLFALNEDLTKAWAKMNEYMNKKETVFLHADLVGSTLLEPVINYVTDLGYSIVNLYSNGIDEYPECARKLCTHVLSDKYNIGILLCGTGIGMSIAANKIDGIRAAVVSDPFSARAAKEHNNANVLCLGSRVVTSYLAKQIVEEFLNSSFLHGKHQPRVERIDSSKY